MEHSRRCCSDGTCRPLPACVSFIAHQTKLFLREVSVFLCYVPLFLDVCAIKFHCCYRIAAVVASSAFTDLASATTTAVAATRIAYYSCS